MIRCVLFILALTACSATAVTAQTTDLTFLPRATFRLTGEHLSSDDARYVWDTRFAGELDVIDYGVGRATFLISYEAVLGEQLRAFDPNQGNYILAASASARAAGLELAGVFHHESRHLSDRIKIVPVDWNMLGGRVSKAVTSGRARMAGRADLRGVVQKSFVDYTWEFDLVMSSHLALRPRVALISAVDLRVLGVDGSRNRSTQTGFRGEGGMRFEGKAGAAELFLAAERRIDPYPLEFSTVTWVSAGFRLLTR